jgi:hypothetical protein
MMSGLVLVHRQLSPEDLQELFAWYKIRDMLLGQNCVEQDIKKALELASVCEHPDSSWLTNLFAGRVVFTDEDARQVFLGCENDDPRALCFAGALISNFDEIRRAAELGDAFAQAEMIERTIGQESFRWAEKSAVQGERDGFYELGHCYRYGIGCERDTERAKGNFLVAAKLGHVYSMEHCGEFKSENDPQRLVWLARAAAANMDSFSFLNEMCDQVHNFNSGTGHAKVMFVIGRALKGHNDNEELTIFGSDYMFDSVIIPANQALRFYEFQLQSFRKAVDSWTIIGLRNGVVKDIRKMIGKMIWDAREDAMYLEKK